jgi:hypothetical protein
MLAVLLLVFLILSFATAPTTQPANRENDLPASMTLPDDGLSLTVNLNDQALIPGSDGKLTLTVRDATQGQVNIRLAAPQRDVIPVTTAGAGDELAFHLEAQDYVLRVEKVVTMTLGDDYAMFTLLDLATAQRQRIERDLNRIEQSDLTFLLDLRDCTGGEMAKYLREQLETIGKDPAAATQPASSFTDLLEGVNPVPATMSSTAATEPLEAPPPALVRIAHCRVRTHEGQVIELSAWLGRRQGQR